MARRQRRREGFRFLGPFPTYTRRTRGGGRVSFGGCCLPAFVGLMGGAAGVARLAVLSLRRAR